MGHHNRHFSGDRFALSGFWAPPTSTANFCEEDYAVTVYIAEFINSLSSLAYVYFALRFRRPWRDPLLVALFLVGVTSTAYHATLRQGPQFSDDLSMCLIGACLLQKVYTQGQTPFAVTCITAAIWSSTITMSVVYVRSGDILIHLLLFSAMVHLIWPRTLYLIYYGAGASQAKHDRSRLMRRFGKAAFVLVFAFVVWNIDLEKCMQLRALRHKLGLPWAWLLELHGWWHVLTAVGASEYISLVKELCIT